MPRFQLIQDNGEAYRAETVRFTTEYVVELAEEPVKVGGIGDAAVLGAEVSKVPRPSSGVYAKTFRLVRIGSGIRL